MGSMSSRSEDRKQAHNDDVLSVLFGWWSCQSMYAMRALFFFMTGMMAAPV